MFTKSIKVSPADGINGMILTDYPNQKEISFFADIPVRAGNITTVITAVKHDGRYLQDIEGASVKYHRENTEDNLRHVATVTFPEGIPEAYLSKLMNYQAEDFIVEYHEEAIVEVK